MAPILRMAEIGALVGDPARANMLEALLDRRALTAKELAAQAGVSAQTASGHLAKLTTAGLITVEQHGRFRYHRLACIEVAAMLESIMQVAARNSGRRVVRTGPREAAMRVARSCYDHLAGQLAVCIADAMRERGQIEFDGDAGALTETGHTFLCQFGADLSAAATSKRVFCRPCLDCSERRPHLAGAVGAALMQRSLDLGWVKRVSGSRTLTITRDGENGFQKTFGVGPFR